VTKYLPELGEAFRRVRIRHLMRHTSGLTRRDDALLRCCALAAESGLDEAAHKLSAAKPSPGVGFVYANSNYVLLAAVLERVSGQPFPELMQQVVFRPLRMRRTTLDVAEARRWGLADPHCCFGGEVRPDPSLFLGWYGSSLVKSTANDMAAYLGWLLSNARGGWSEPYDRGWFVRRRKEWLTAPFMLEHGGNTRGGNTAALVVPAWRLGVVVLLNSGANRAVDIARGVAARYMGFAAPPPRKQR
jgi:CubicO group peptidase (beta-lactamase class C family)